MFDVFGDAADARLEPPAVAPPLLILFAPLFNNDIVVFRACSLYLLNKLFLNLYFKFKFTNPLDS